MITLSRRHLLLAALAGMAACGQQPEPPVTPAEIEPGRTCDLDGMLLADYPGPKAQIHFAGETEPHWYCDTVEMFSTLLRPEQQKRVRAVFTQDMGKADWAEPRGHWFDARTGFYVVGSRRRGSMGVTVPGFVLERDAQDFAATHGGRVLRYADVKPEMVDLRGGALHDGKM